jgi:hypothetical protein
MVTLFTRTKLSDAKSGMQTSFFSRMARRMYAARMEKAMGVVNKHRHFFDFSCR